MVRVKKNLLDKISIDWRDNMSYDVYLNSVNKIIPSVVLRDNLSYYVLYKVVNDEGSY